MSRNNINRDPHRFGVPVSEYDSLQDLLQSKNINSGISVVKCGSRFIDMQYIPEPSDTLLVMFNGAITADARTIIPNFEFYKLTENLRVSKLFIADPALEFHTDIATGWYTGASDMPLQSMLPLIIEKFSKSRTDDNIVSSAKTSKIVLFGNSAGGFGAMCIGSQIPGSLVIASAPQTNLQVHTRESIALFARHCFNAGNEGAVQVVLDELICSNLIPIYAQQPATKLIYLQNRSDWHINYHLKPFLAGLGLPESECNYFSSDIAVVVGEWGEGHILPPVNFIEWLLKTVCEYSESNFEKLLNTSFNQKIESMSLV